MCVVTCQVVHVEHLVADVWDTVLGCVVQDSGPHLASAPEAYFGGSLRLEPDTYLKRG